MVDSVHIEGHPMNRETRSQRDEHFNPIIMIDEVFNFLHLHLLYKYRECSH